MTFDGVKDQSISIINTVEIQLTLGMRIYFSKMYLFQFLTHIEHLLCTRHYAGYVGHRDVEKAVPILEKLKG